MVALDDGECRIASGIEKRIFQTLDEGERRFFFIQAEQESIKRVFCPFGIDENALWGILNPAAETELSGQAKHKRPEPYALHRPTDDNMNAPGGQRNPM